VEELAAQRLAAAQDTMQQVRESSRATEAILRDQLGSHAAELARAMSDASAAKLEAGALDSRLTDEKAAHEATRQLLLQSLAARRENSGEPSAAPVKRTGRRS